ncbi:MAG TPA: CoA transferase, partial [Ilumatobacteraceae bacterium]|nr:CoA transferase [Ilumatobacteraceae bacterium]
SFEQLVVANPTLVYCAITGYGEDGPWAARPAHGLQPDLCAGAVPIDWTDGVPKIPAGYKAHGATLAGLWAALGITAGLLRRPVLNAAQYVSVSLWEAALAWMWREGVNDLNGLDQRPDFQELGSRYRMYVGSDSAAILVCPTEEKFWVRFVDELGLPESWRSIGDWTTGADNGFGREQEAAAIAERIATAPAHEWDARLTAAGVPVAVVQSVGDAYRSPQAVARGSTVRVDGQDGAVYIPLSPLSVSAAERLSDGSVVR